MILTIALLVNVIVAGFWGIVLSGNLLPRWSRGAYGTDGPGLRVLGALYLTIALISGCALAYPLYMPLIVSVLFPFQIIYKLLTCITVSNIRNPVVLSNLAIAALLGYALFTLFFTQSA